MCVSGQTKWTQSAGGGGYPCCEHLDTQHITNIKPTKPSHNSMTFWGHPEPKHQLLFKQEFEFVFFLSFVSSSYNAVPLRTEMTL